ANREASRRARALEVLTTFAEGVAAAQSDPKALLVWQPLARTARALDPEAFAAIDAAAQARFPFTVERLRDAHSQWTADWLAWERAHDAECKRRALEVEHDPSLASNPPVLRARLDAVEREKLDLYQRRYEEYVRVAKALQALVDSATT